MTLTTEQAIEELNDMLAFEIDEFGEVPETEEAVHMAINALKERKTGKWIFGETMGHSWMKCSECCKSQDGQTLCFTYCPNCGAKMEVDGRR